jgi:hypothetical protein
MTDKLEGFERKRSWLNREAIPEFFGGNEEDKKNVSQYSWCLGQESNQEAPE